MGYTQAMVGIEGILRVMKYGQIHLGLSSGNDLLKRWSLSCKAGVNAAQQNYLVVTVQMVCLAQKTKVSGGTDWFCTLFQNSVSFSKSHAMSSSKSDRSKWYVRIVMSSSLLMRAANRSTKS